MKKLLYFTLFLIGLQAFSQKKTITFTMVDGKPKAAATATAPKLPVIFSFSEDFSGKAVNLTQDNKVIALRNAKFGDSELSKDGETGTYKILIDKNGIVNPGNGKVKAGSFKLNVDGASFEIKPQTESAPARTGNTARTGDGGESAEEEEPSPSARESTNYDPGYIYYDALSLVGNDVDGGTKAMILKAYDIDGTNIDENPYLDNAIDFDNLVEGGSAASLLSNLGGMDVTYFAAGLARFLAERTKEELNEAFFRKMKDQLNTYPELTTLFPQTTSYLNNIETYSYAAIEQLLKEAFETDIRNLPENLYELKNLTKAACNNEFLKDPKKIAKCQARMDNIEAFFDSRNGHWTGLGMFTLKEAIGSGNPADLLKLVTESTELEELKVFSESGSLYTDLNVASAIELANLLSQSLISKDEGQVWVNSNQITKLLKTKNALMVYLGLLIQRQKVDHSFITFYKGDGTKVAFNDFWINGYADYAIYEPQLKSIIKDAATAFTAANSAVRKIAAAVDNSTQAD
ncbi:MAG TPA: hypothetical protein VK528_00790, partial [Flavobacterium sp.]|nr:hypothetical protein [Flavobacterium sp.]